MNKFLLIVLSLLLYGSTFAQLSVTDGHTAQELADYFTGESITPFNCTLTGEAEQLGKFTFTGDQIGVNSGVILSTGDILDAEGSNDVSDKTTEFGNYGDDYLEDIYGFDTYDAVVLEFDFTVQSSEISFNYVFLSEEYDEPIVADDYDDVFAFVISGPGITGEKNLAVIPGTTLPITTSSINDSTHWQFFKANPQGNPNIQFDGYTTLMTAKAENLTACSTYHLKLVIADGGDEAWDSGVLLQESSLSQSNLTVSTNTYSGNNIAIESCIEANFSFELDKPQPEDKLINLTIAGTAVNGVDYEYIDPQVIIPAGQTKATLLVKAINDGITEGQESIFLIYNPAPCQDADTAKLFIDDYNQIIFTATPEDVTCNGASNGKITFDIDGGYAPYTYNLTDTLTKETSSYTVNPITGLDSATYLIEVIDSYGCKAEDLVFGGQFTGGQVFLPDGTGVSYESVIPISGFNDGQVLESADQIVAITAVLEHSYVNDLSVVVQAPNGSQVKLKDFAMGGGGSCDLGEPVASGPIDSWNSSNTMAGIGYEYTWNANPTFGTMDYQLSQPLLSHTYVSTYGNTLTDTYLPAGSYTPINSFDAFIGTQLNGDWKIIVTDNMYQDNGYIFSWNLSLKADRPDSIVTVSQPPLPIVIETITNSTCGNSDGGISISVSGDHPPFTYLWNTGETVNNISGKPSGAYSVAVSDANTCTYDFGFNISDNGGSLSLSANITNETCVDADNGAIDLTATGTAPIVYSWSNGESTEDINSLAPNTYTVTVSDASGCNKVETYTVEEASAMIVSETIVDEHCGDAEGKIDINIVGGKSPFTFSWDNGEITQNVDELAQGDYTVTITDANTCTKVLTYHINNQIGNCVPDCDLEVQNAVLTNETCGSQNGAIDLTIFTSNSPYNVEWSNSATTDDIENLHAGNYSATIIDAEGCKTIKTYILENHTGDLAIANLVATNETCGNGTGALDLTMSGGALPYTFAWSNSETSEDISNLHAGAYTVTVSDANGCSVSQTKNVANNAGTLNQTWGTTANETCGNGEGSIDVDFEGGTTPYTYTWTNSTETTQDLIDIHTGAYKCTVTDADGCSLSTVEYTIEDEAGTLNIDDIDVDNEVCGNGLGEIELVISGGTEPYAYTWNTGQDTRDIFNLSANTYSATISDNNGCSVSTGNLNLINEAGTLTLEDITVTDENCGNSQGAIDITVTHGTTPYAFAWNNGNTAEDLAGLSEGAYSCTITDNNGCEISFNTTVNNNQGNLSVDDIVATDETCGNGNGEIDLTISGGANPLTYAWNNSATTQDLTSLSAGNYTCTITDLNGCQQTASATVNNDAGTLSLDGHTVTNEECGQGNGAITLTISGGTGTATYSWDNGADTKDISGLSAGTYTCTITDGTGCSITAGAYTVNNFSSTLTIDNTTIVDEVCENGQGSINLTVSGGVTPYAFAWSNSEDTEDITGLSAGTYTYVITDDGGCSINGSVEVNNNSGTLDLESYHPTNEHCGNHDGEITLTVSGGATPYSYSWNNGATTPSLENLSAGTFSVVITDNNGCDVTSSNITIINDNGDIAIDNADLTHETCGLGNGAIDISRSGGIAPFTYAWSNGFADEDLENVHAGNYTIQITDNEGCVATENYTITNSVADFSISNINVTNEACGQTNGAIDLTISPTATYTYSWNTGATTEDLTNLSAGNYTCEVTNATGCKLTETYTVTNETGGFSANIGATTNDYCGSGTGSVNLVVSGGSTPYSYVWSNGATTQNIIDVPAGNYTVAITDNAGCTVNISHQVMNDINTELAITNINITNETCGSGNGEITYDAAVAGTYTYKLNGASNMDNTPSFDNLSADTYTISIHDGGCVVQEDVIIENETSFTTTTYMQNVSCMGSGDDGAAFVQVAPMGDYTYLWSNGTTAEMVDNLTAGTYTCVVTNVTDNCQKTVSVLIETEGWYMLSAITSDETCGNSNGAIDLTVDDGGTGNTHTYLWSNGATTEDITDISAGEYTCEVSDDWGCNISITKTVENNTGTMEVSNSVSNDNCGASSGSINLTITGANNGYSVVWNTGATTDNISGLAEGNYSVTIINTETNCEFTESYNIETVGLYTVSENITNSSCETCTDGSITQTLIPADGIYTFDWNNGANTKDINGLLPGDYNVTINNNFGCEKNKNYHVGFEIVSVDNVEGITLKAYPNPAKDIIYFEYEFKNSNPEKIEIYNIIGNVVAIRSIQNPKSKLSFKIQELPAGVYLAKISSEKEAVYVKFIIEK